MSSTSPQTLVEQLRWRYATKKFDPAKTIHPALWAALEESLVLSPSSYGLQPWKFMVITDPGLKARLKAVSWNQPQVEDCSHHVVFLAKKTFGVADIDRFLERMAEVRGVSVDSLKMYRGYMVGDLVEGPRAAMVREWAVRQVYLALGVFLSATAMVGVDTCPLEGIDSAQYDAILGLEGTDWTAVVACPAGYRSESDKYATLPKVRYKAEELIERR
ncbi:MAG: NAD(P)H-dependent oxidoreductase [Firmicutes bacterium]|nr:NAD(P)H-dependent oxidoreductase [Bacillota bacterium]